MVIYLDHLLPNGSSDIFKEPSEQRQAVLFSLASGGVYRATIVTNHAVVSYTAFPPSPHKWQFISVALSLKSPSLVVSQHPVL